MRTTVRHFLLILVAISLTSGCELATAELGASYRVSVDGAQLYVNGYFYDVVRGDDFVRLVRAEVLGVPTAGEH